ncbi:MAG: KpsF/GutQ family sugar-phosphate isomerase [Pseudohongiellaceae bacterium]
MVAKPSLIDSAKRTIDIELKAIASLADRIDSDFQKACEIILAASGRVVVTGMGKSGHIGNKIAATLASTGTPAMAMHPAEASHGDLGMITATDVVLAISNSGNTEELTSLLPALKRKGIPLICMTGDRDSLLSQAADVALDISVAEEACPLGLAPTSSTTATLVMGDALAMALLEARGFTHDDFAMSHPGGKLGRRLLVRVQDLMHSGDEIPTVSAETSLSDALIEMSQKGFGLTTVVDAQTHVLGVFTDGDLRRALDAGKDIQHTPINAVMSTTFKTIAPGALAVEAAKAMQDANVYVLLVKEQDQPLTGIIKMHDLLQANVV